MEDRNVDRLQNYFNEREVDSVMRLYTELDKMMDSAKKAGKPTDKVMALISMTADILADVTSNGNKIIHLTKSLDETQKAVREANLRSDSWRYKYFNARKDIENRVDLDNVNSNSSNLDFKTHI